MATALGCTAVPIKRAFTCGCPRWITERTEIRTARAVRVIAVAVVGVGAGAVAVVTLRRSVTVRRMETVRVTRRAGVAAVNTAAVTVVAVRAAAVAATIDRACARGSGENRSFFVC